MENRPHILAMTAGVKQKIVEVLSLNYLAKYVYWYIMYSTRERDAPMSAVDICATKDVVTISYLQV